MLVFFYFRFRYKTLLMLKIVFNFFILLLLILPHSFSYLVTMIIELFFFSHTLLKFRTLIFSKIKRLHKWWHDFCIIIWQNVFFLIRPIIIGHIHSRLIIGLYLIALRLGLRINGIIWCIIRYQGLFKLAYFFLLLNVCYVLFFLYLFYFFLNK